MPYNMFDSEYTGNCLFGNLIMFDCGYQGAVPCASVEDITE